MLKLVGGFGYTELHNRVHIYIGGTTLIVPQASNDPIFFLHHCNIDRLYEEWLDQYSYQDFPSYEPSTFNYEINPGQNIDEYLHGTNISTDHKWRNAHKSKITWLYLQRGSDTNPTTRQWLYGTITNGMITYT